MNESFPVSTPLLANDESPVRGLSQLGCTKATTLLVAVSKETFAGRFLWSASAAGRMAEGAPSGSLPRLPPLSTAFRATGLPSLPGTECLVQAAGVKYGR